MNNDLLQCVFLELEPELRKIARWSSRDFSLDEIRSEAWIIAADMELDAPAPMDWRDPEVCKELMRRLRSRCAYSQRKHRKPLRLDQAIRGGGDDELPELIHSVAAPEVSDPLVELLKVEEAATSSRNHELPWHHSEGTAYLHLVEQLGMRQLASFLRISLSHCYRRCGRAVIPDREHQEMLGIGAAGRRVEVALQPWRRYKIRRQPWQMLLDFGGDLFHSGGVE